MTTEAAIVHIVDDEQELANEIAKIVKSVGLCVETYSSATDFLSRYESGKPGCVITDIRMPRLSGTDLQDRLLALNDPIPIIFISGYADVATTVRVMSKGARYLFEKGSSTNDLIAAIQKAVDEDVHARANAKLQAEISARFNSLSAREKDILRGVLKGQTNKEIGESYGISANTVEIHRARVKTKMNADTLAELIRMCLTHNIGDLT